MWRGACGRREGGWWTHGGGWFGTTKDKAAWRADVVARLKAKKIDLEVLARDNKFEVAFEERTKTSSREEGVPPTVDGWVKVIMEKDERERGQELFYLITMAEAALRDAVDAKRKEQEEGKLAEVVGAEKEKLKTLRIKLADCEKKLSDRKALVQASPAFIEEKEKLLAELYEKKQRVQSGYSLTTDEGKEFSQEIRDWQLAWQAKIEELKIDKRLEQNLRDELAERVQELNEAKTAAVAKSNPTYGMGQWAHVR